MSKHLLQDTCKIRTAWLAALALCTLLFSCRRVEVETELTAGFTYAVVDSNYNIPVRVNLTNTSTGAQFYKWTFSNGNPATSDYKDPGFVIFNQPGPITIKLEAWNDYGRKEKIIQLILDTVPKSRFTVAPRINNYAPVDWDFNFTGEGVTQFSWTFEGGTPAVSTDKNPQAIHYAVPGIYRVKLQVKNNRGRTDTSSQLITVQPSLSSAFDIEPSFDDDDYEAPLTAQLSNHSTSATQHRWLAPGGVINNPADSLPSVYFANPGTYTITYIASNNKQTDTITKSITVLPNTGLRSFSNIKLGINTAQNTHGSFFSTYLRKVIRGDSVNTTNGPKIDLCFFGLSSSFNFNKFITPAETQNWTFAAIPGATQTIYINKQESCSCGVNVSAADFDAISNGSFFNSISVVSTAGGDADFSNAVIPRVILFRNAAGKKGAVKIKQFVADGDNSYVLCDIKVQKD